MPSLVGKMQPLTQTHSIIPASITREGWLSTASSVTTPLSTASSTTSLLSRGSSSDSGDSVLMMGSSNSHHHHLEKKSHSSDSSPPLPPRGGGGARTGSFLSKLRSGSSGQGGSGGSSTSSNNCNNSINGSNTNNNNCNGSRPKRKTPILSTCMSNWVKFDHDCQKPLPCSDCESEQEKNRKVLFTSGGNVMISAGKGRNHHHRHSHHFCSSQNNENLHHHRHSSSRSEPASPVDSGNASGPSSIDSNNSAFSGEVVSWENAKNKSSFKIVINVPFLDMNVFQNENVQVEIVCNKNKLATGKDFETVQRNRTELKCSGWYWESIDSEASMEILESTDPGSFIIRDSADPRFLYSLSVQTERGPTSVRLTYRNGKFCLDADEKLVELLPKFDSVIRLIEYYVMGGTKVGKQVWVDPKGNMHSTVKLTKPMRKEVGSLKHLARVAINKYGLLNNNMPSSSTKPSQSSPFVPLAEMMGTVPKAEPSKSTDENRIGSVPTYSNIVTPVVDLSKLPMSLQTYILDYPYNL